MGDKRRPGVAWPAIWIVLQGRKADGRLLAQRLRRGNNYWRADTVCSGEASWYSQRFQAASTAFGYSGRPRLPL
jgi:hypothetical protein